MRAKSSYLLVQIRTFAAGPQFQQIPNPLGSRGSHLAAGQVAARCGLKGLPSSKTRAPAATDSSSLSSASNRYSSLKTLCAIMACQSQLLLSDLSIDGYTNKYFATQADAADKPGTIRAKWLQSQSQKYPGAASAAQPTCSKMWIPI